MSQPIGVCILVLDAAEQKILFGKRKNSYREGTFGMPGGRVEVGEKIADTAIRELKEETGLITSDVKYLGVVKENQGELDFIHFVFLCNHYEGEAQLLEPEKCEGWEWFDLANLPEVILPGHALAIQLYLKKPEDNFIEV